jgi:hypothetical protein
MFKETKKTTEAGKTASFDKQLGLIMEHVTELQDVNDRVNYSEKVEHYKDALPSAKSSMGYDLMLK